MKESKIKIEIEIDITDGKPSLHLSITKGGKEIEAGDITVRELIAMYVGVIIAKENLEMNAKDNGLDFEKALEGKKDKRGVLDCMVDWETTGSRNLAIRIYQLMR